MSFVAREDEKDVVVTMEDQKKINRFSKLLNERVELESRLKSRKELKQLYDDCSDELMLIDDDQPVQHALGDVFMFFRKDYAESRIEKTKAALEKELNQIEEELLKVRDDMAELKAQLYAKFGKTINLEDDY